MTAPTSDTLGTLLDVLDVQQVDDDTYIGGSLPQPGVRVFGGHVLAQSLLVAARTVPTDRLPH